MEFRIADTFTDSLAKLTGEEQKAVKTAAFDLQLKPAHPALQFHKLEKSKDPNFWSVRVNLNVRMIVHRTGTSLLLCYVNHHDEAYQWAKRRKPETHPKTGAAQLVEVRETVQEITIPRYVDVEQTAPAKPRLFADISEDRLLSYGVPAEWLNDVRAANEDTVLELAGHLPTEAAEALLDLATGVTPQITQPVAAANPFHHPDAQRRFRVMNNLEERSARSTIRGRNGRSSCIRHNASWWNGISTAPHGFRVRRAPGRPSWLSIARSFWLAPIGMRGSC